MLVNSGPLFTARKHVRHVNSASLARAARARTQYREIARCPEAVGFRLAAMAYAMDEFVQLFADRVVLGKGHGTHLLFAALERAQATKQIVIGARFLAVDIEHVEFRRRRIGGGERRNSAVLVLEDEARDVWIVARKNEMGQ